MPHKNVASFSIPIAVLSLFAWALPGFAQTATSPEATTRKSATQTTYGWRKTPNEFGVWGGGASHATTTFGGVKGDEAEDRSFLIVGLRYGRVLRSTNRMSLKYTFDIIPAAIAHGVIVDRTTGAPGPAAETRGRATVYGAGLNPVGLQFLFRPNQRVQPFLHIGGGFLWFEKPVPLPGSGKFAFVGEDGFGLQIFTQGRRAVTLGARFHHISNGGRHDVNRSLNNLVFYIGSSVFR